MFLSDYETETDLLYYEVISKTVVRLIQDAGDKPVSIGIHGDWGAGKSSILAMTKGAMEKEPGTVCVWFNGWQFQGFDDAKTVLIERILIELQNNQSIWQKAKAEVLSLMKRVRWFRLARLGASLVATAHTGLPFLLSEVPPPKATGEGEQKGDKKTSEFVNPLSNYFDPAESKSMPQQMEEFRKEFEEIFKKAGISKLVVLLDDLDRCLPNTAIDTLEAIKLFLFVPRAVFVIGADEAMIEYAVRKHFPDLPLGQGSQTYARNYLEKVIQVPFRIPAMGIGETRVYVALLYLEATVGNASAHFKTLREIGREALRKPWETRLFDREIMNNKFGAKFPDGIASAITLSDQIAPMLTEQTKGNPRQVKRFLNALFLRQQVAAARGLSDEIKTRTLAKIMLVERFFETFYESLAIEVAASGDGKLEWLQDIEREDGKSESKRKGKRKSSLSEWDDSPEIRAWAKLDPPLGDEDLRPYILITRDRRNVFAGAGAEHEALLQKLSGGKLAVAGVSNEVKGLRPEVAAALFDELCARIRAREQYESLPEGAVGLGELAKTHQSLQKRLVEFAAELPIGVVGPWVLGDSGWDSALKDVEARRAWSELLKKWAEQGQNRPLAAAAAGVAALRK